MKRFKKVLVGLVMSVLIMSFNTDVLFAKQSNDVYDYVDDNHAVSNISHISDSNYTYSLFCVKSQKTQPSSEKTTKCSFFEEDITESCEYVEDEHMAIVKEKNDMLVREKERHESIGKITIFGFILAGVIIFNGFLIYVCSDI